MTDENDSVGGLIFLRGILVFTDLAPQRELSTRAR